MSLLSQYHYKKPRPLKSYAIGNNIIRWKSVSSNKRAFSKTWVKIKVKHSNNSLFWEIKISRCVLQVKKSNLYSIADPETPKWEINIKISLQKEIPMLGMLLTILQKPLQNHPRIRLHNQGHTEIHTKMTKHGDDWREEQNLQNCLIEQSEKTEKRNYLKSWKKWKQ